MGQHAAWRGQPAAAAATAAAAARSVSWSVGAPLPSAAVGRSTARGGVSVVAAAAAGTRAEDRLLRMSIEDDRCSGQFLGSVTWATSIESCLEFASFLRVTPH